MKYCRVSDVPCNGCWAYTIPSILLVEAGTGDDEWQSLQLAILLLHGKRQYAWFVVQALYEGRIIAMWGEDLHIEFQIRI